MTINEEFDELFKQHFQKNGDAKGYCGIKRFYNDKMKEMVKAMVGEYIDCNGPDYEVKRQEIINTALKYGVDIKE